MAIYPSRTTRRSASLVLCVLLAALLATTAAAGAGGTLEVGGAVAVAPGETVDVSFTLENTGSAGRAYLVNVSAPAGWSVESVDADGGVWKASNTTWLFRTVSAGERVTPTVSLTAPADATGTVTVGATANTSEGTAAAVDRELAVTGDDGSTEALSADGASGVAPGESATVSFDLSNLADRDRAFVLNVAVPHGWSVANASDDGGVWKQSNGRWLFRTVPAGGTVSPAVEVHAPDNATGAATVSAVTTTDEGTAGAATRSLDVSSGGSSGPSRPGGSDDNDADSGDEADGGDDGGDASDGGDGGANVGDETPDGNETEATATETTTADDSGDDGADDGQTDTDGETPSETASATGTGTTTTDGGGAQPPATDDTPSGSGTSNARVLVGLAGVVALLGLVGWWR